MKHRLTRRQAIAAMAVGVLVVVLAPAGGAQAANADKIIISGASGHLGILTIKELLARGVSAKNLILVSRTPDTLGEFVKLGAVARFGDLSKPESLAAAYAGGTRMLLISIGGGSLPRPVAHKNAIDAAVKAGVKQIAYTSWIALSKGDASGIGADHAQTEEILKNSGVAWTFLRNSIYADQLIPQAAKMVADGSFVLPAKVNRLGYVTRKDCAAAAAAVLSTPGHDNKAYNITGPELVGPAEVAAAASEATGRKIEAIPAPKNAPPAPSFGGPALEVVSTAVADLTGRPATPVRTLFAANKDKLLGSSQ
jgi:NAD(P)H dehydrogenase (quinone)